MDYLLAEVNIARMLAPLDSPQLADFVAALDPVNAAADHHELVVTPWLVRRGRPELTLEHEIGQPGWAGVFTEADRDEAARRLARAGMTPPA